MDGWMEDELSKGYSESVTDMLPYINHTICLKSTRNQIFSGSLLGSSSNHVEITIINHRAPKTGRTVCSDEQHTNRISQRSNKAAYLFEKLGISSSHRVWRQKEAWQTTTRGIVLVSTVYIQNLRTTRIAGSSVRKQQIIK